MPLDGVSWIGAAGFDYRELVKKIIQAESKPITLMQSRMARFDLARTAWTDVKTRLQNLSSALTDLSLDSTFKSRTAASSNTGVVTAAADTTAAVGTYNVSVTALARAHVIRSDAQASGWTLSATDLNTDGRISFTLNGAEVVVANGDTLPAIRDKINQTGGVGVTASVIDNQLVLKANSTGTANAIVVTADPDGVLGALGVVNSGTTTIKNEVQAAADAAFSVDGLNLTRSSNTVTDVIGGVTLTLVGTGSEVTVTVGRDIQKAVDKVKAFVDQYNSVLDLVRQKLGKDAAGKPGDLYQDPALGRLEQTLRKHVSDIVSGLTVYTRLADIGITTSGTSNGGDLAASETGRLKIDEAKLRAALESDAGAVKELFFASSEAVKGVGEVLKEDVDLYAGSGGVIPGQVNLLTARRAGLDKEIQRLQALLAKREQTLINRFVAAEKLLTLLQQQGSFLSSQLSTWQLR